MTLYEFNALDELEQIQAVWLNGVEIGHRIEGEYAITLFQIDAFYVEMWNHIEHNVVKRFSSFSSTNQLAPYTGTLDISDIFNNE